MWRAVAAGVVVAALIVAAVALVGVWGAHRLAAPGPLAAETTVVVPRGAGLDAIAALLRREGVIREPLLFAAAARLSGVSRDLRAGEYAFPARASAREVLRILERGETVVRRLTIAEGLTTAQVFTQLAAADGLMGPLPPAPDEGRLLPETYHFTYGDRRRDMVRRMTEAMNETLAELWPKRDPDLPLETPEDALTLASIVEKETARPDERARIAGVFVNRLARGMRLQSDPTVVYALTGGSGPLGRPLTRADLEIEHPYNTYANAGLPPGPIANPGRASIRAVLQPEETDALYFVADGTGGHVFSRTLEEHNRNAARWREMRRETGETPADGETEAPAPETGSTSSAREEGASANP